MKYIIALFLLFTTSHINAQANTWQLSTHILDIGKGLPATDVTVELQKLNEQDNTWSFVDRKITDINGRIPDFLKKKIEIMKEFINLFLEWQIISNA
ncbi:MAG: hydroxyisourate hydrolase, partial [Ginsengibacter sp.]